MACIKIVTLRGNQGYLYFTWTVKKIVCILGIGMDNRKNPNYSWQTVFIFKNKLEG